MSDKMWNGTWKPDGTGGWHTKIEKDIVDQYNSARLTPAPAQMLKDAIDEVVRLRAENEKLRDAYDTDALTISYNLGYTCGKDMAKDEIERLCAKNKKLREDERERCARICEENNDDAVMQSYGTYYATRIRKS